MAQKPKKPEEFWFKTVHRHGHIRRIKLKIEKKRYRQTKGVSDVEPSPKRKRTKDGDL
jgi:hypothetical protein